MPRKINVKGTSGSGKSTFAAALARRLGLPHASAIGADGRDASSGSGKGLSG